MRRTASTRFSGLLTLGASLLLGLSACSDEGVGDEAPDTETSTSGDSDGDGATTNGDGDGDDPTAGDGDGDPTTNGDGDGDPTNGDGDGDQPCVYPDAAEPMALNQPLAAYAWPEALRNNFVSAPLNLENAYCDADEEIDWSPHDILVFISLPAW